MRPNAKPGKTQDIKAQLRSPKKQQSCFYSQHKIVETEEAMRIFGRKITKLSKYQINFTKHKLLGTGKNSQELKKNQGDEFFL